MNSPNKSLTEDAISQAAQSILKTVAIPAQPQIVMDLMKLSRNQNIDINQIAQKVQKDPSLAAKVLKISNSPLFGLRRPVDSVSQALNFMGFQMFQRAVLASALRDTFVEGQSDTCEAFWIHSEIAARCCEIVAKKLRPEFVQQAYLTGLFHDCAIPILRKKFSDYDHFTRKSLHYRHEVVLEEDQRYKTNHCVMGYIFTRSWQLPDPVRLAILRHHDEEPQYTDNTDARILTAILKVSEYIIQDYDTSGNIKTIDADKWMDIYENSVDILGMVPQDIVDFEEKLLEDLNR